MIALRTLLLTAATAALMTASAQAREAENNSHRPAVREAATTETRTKAEEGGMSKGLGAQDKFKKDLENAKEQKRKGEIAEGTDDAVMGSKSFKGNTEGQGAKGGDASEAIKHQQNMAELKKQCTVTCTEEVDNPKTPYNPETEQDKSGMNGLGKAVGKALSPLSNPCAGAIPPAYYPPGCTGAAKEAYDKKKAEYKAERKAKIDACVKECMKVKTSGFDGVSLGGGNKH